MKFTDPKGTKTSDGSYNIILTNKIKLNIEHMITKRNCNILLIGGAGAGKSFYFVGPNILQANTNYVITDPSGDLLDKYGKYLENQGYKVSVFNLVEMEKGNKYNPFHYIHEANDIFILVETFMQNTTPSEGHSGDPFWEKSEKTLLNAVISLVWMYFPEEDQTFAKVLELVLMAQIDENDATVESKLDAIFAGVEKIDPDSIALQHYKTFKIGAGKTLKSILISVAVRLNAFTLPKVKFLTSSDDLKFEEFGDTKHALFVVIPTADTTFNFLAAMMYSQLFGELYSCVETQGNFIWKLKLPNRDVVHVEHAHNKKESKEAKRRMEEFVATLKDTKIRKNEDRDYYEIVNSKNEIVSWRGTKEEAKAYADSLSTAKIEKGVKEDGLPIHTRMILDEFANLGTIPSFSEKLATVRKYQISCAIILQGITQLQTMYKDEWSSIVGNCDTWLYLGGNNLESQKWVSEQLGKRTTVLRNESYQSGKDGGGSMSLNLSSIELMAVDALARMKDTDCIVSVRGNRPYYGAKYRTMDDPRFKKAMKLHGEFQVKTNGVFVEEQMQKGGLQDILKNAMREKNQPNHPEKEQDHETPQKGNDPEKDAERDIDRHKKKRSGEYRDNRDAETGDPIISDPADLESEIGQDVIREITEEKTTDQIAATLEENEEMDFAPDPLDEFDFESL